MTDTATRNSALLVTTLASFLMPFMASSVNIVLPAIAAEFTMDAVLLSWVATAYLLAAAVFLVPMGRAADIWGRKTVFVLGMAVYLLASLLVALSSSATLLIAFRALQGIGATMTFGTGMAILTSVFPAQERGRALGITTAAVYVGLSVGPFVGGLLAHHLGWRSIFLLNVPLALLVITVALAKLKGEWADARGERFDLFGSVLYGLALVAVMYGFSVLPRIWGAWLLAAGVLGIVAFFRWESRQEHPVFDVRLFRRNTPFVFSNLAALIHYSATFAVTFLLSLYLQYIKGLNAERAGLILMAQPVVMAMFSPLAGRLSDRVEPRIVASIGMAITSTGLFLLAFLNHAASIPYVVLGLVVLGFGFALFSSPNSNAIMSAVERKHYGVASATVGTMRLSGQMFSMGLVTVIFALLIGRVQITPACYGEFITSVRITFGLFCLLCLAGAFVSLARGRVRSG